MALDGAPGEVQPPLRVDLHCHTRASFDGVAEPEALVTRAAQRGLTHLAITDHETLDGALRAAASAPAGIHVLIGCEVNTPEGDLIFVFLQRALPRGLSAREAIDAGREQGALVGIPHPYDPARRSLLRDPANEELVGMVDWVEAWNGRVTSAAVNAQAAALAVRTGRPGIGASDAHTLLEIGTAYTTMNGDPSTPAGLLAALRGPLTIEGGKPTIPPRRFPRLGRKGFRREGAAR
jgi:predicted metal-dependent phosphoesterase TrpH